LLASGSADGMIKFWTVSGGAELREFNGGFVNSIAFSPNGKLLASGDDQQARLWDIATGHSHTLPMEFADNVAGVAFSPDGRLLAAGTGLGILHVWDVASRRLVRREDEGSGLDTSMAFSGDCLDFGASDAKGDRALHRGGRSSHALESGNGQAPTRQNANISV
jgi:WD40 repeat protein